MKFLLTTAFVTMILIAAVEQYINQYIHHRNQKMASIVVTKIATGTTDEQIVKFFSFCGKCVAFGCIRLC